MVILYTDADNFHLLAVYYCWTRYKQDPSNTDNSSSNFALSFSTGLDSFITSQETWKWLGKYIVEQIRWIQPLVTHTDFFDTG